MADKVRTELQFLFDVKEDHRIIYCLIKVKAGNVIPVEPFKISYSERIGLHDGSIFINNKKVDYDIISPGPSKSIKIDLVELDELREDISILKDLKSNRDIHILIRYKESLVIEEEDNLSKLKLNFQPEFGSSNTRILFCLPAISKTKRFLFRFIDITRRKIYDVFKPFGVDIKLFQDIFENIKEPIKDSMKSNHFNVKKNKVVVYWDMPEDEITDVGGFAYYLPNVDYWKLSFAIFRYFTALILGIMITNLLT